MEGSGNTSVLNRIKWPDEPYRKTTPTIGFNIETVPAGKYDFNIWDITGQSRLIDAWRYYYPGTNCVIFVVDSCNEYLNGIPNMKWTNIKERLHDCLNDFELQETIFAITCNKQDLNGALRKEEIGEQLELFEYRDCGIEFFDEIDRMNTLLGIMKIPDEILGIIAGYLPRVRDGEKFPGRIMEIFECSAIQEKGLNHVIKWIAQNVK